jgi:hypothetical protein
VGIGTGLAMFGGAITAKETQEDRIKQQIHSLLTQGKIEEAKKMADRYNIEYKYDRQTLEAPENKLSTDDYLDKGDSELLLALYDYVGDKKVITIYAEMCNKYWQIWDQATPKDALAVTWSDTYWQPVSQSASNMNIFGDTQYINYKNYKKHGVWVKINDQKHTKENLGNAKLNVGFTTVLEKLDNTNEYNINAEYLHTWSFGGLSFVTGFNLGPVGLNFNGFGVDNWRLETTKKI